MTIETSLNGKNSMKALLLSQYKQLDIVDVPVAPPGLDEVLARVAACGICGSDVEDHNQPYSTAEKSIIGARELLAGYVVVPSRILYRLPDNVCSVEVVMLVPVSVA